VTAMSQGHCPGCGARLGEVDTMCEGCGTRVTAAPAGVIPMAQGVGGAAVSTSSMSQFRVPDASVVGSLAPLAGLFLLSFAVISAFAGVLGAILHVSPWFFVVLYLLAGGLTFVQPVQEAIAGWFFKARRPTAQEQSRIDAVWAPVARVAGVDPASFVLRVEDSQDINASASGGKLIVLTTGALRQLPDDELSSVVAHELGHHLGLHTVVSGAANWLLLPINTLFTIGNLGARLLNGMARLFGAFGNGPAALVAGVMSLGIQLYMFLFSLFVRLAMALLTIVGRSSEFAADATAARLGYGPALIASLRRMEHSDPEPQTSRNLREVMGATHPRTTERIARLERTPGTRPL
jgi:Zn-dependent protease with chaperone function